MTSFRFPFLFSPPPHSSLRNLSAVTLSVALSATVAVGASVAISRNGGIAFLLADSSMAPKGAPWASLLLSGKSSPVTESRTGTTFPALVKDSQRLLGVGLRRKALLGLKNIDVYSFGVYADESDLENFLGERSGSSSGKEQLTENLIESNIRMTIRLQIVYSRLSISSVRSAFEASVGNRIRKFSGSSDSEDGNDVLRRFIEQFRDEYKIPKGSIIDLSRDKDYVLRTSIDGMEVGSIESKLLCRSILDLYIGDDPFDRKARDEVDSSLASLL